MQIFVDADACPVVGIALEKKTVDSSVAFIGIICFGLYENSIAGNLSFRS